MYKLAFSTDEINQYEETYTYILDTLLFLNLYYVNNHFSKLMFRDVCGENNSERYGLDIWVFECADFNGPLALIDAQEITFNSHQDGFQISIKSASDQIDLQCWRLEIYQHNQDRGTFSPLIDAHRLPIFDKPRTLRKK